MRKHAPHLTGLLSDGMVEHLNRTIQDMLAMYIDRHQRDWDDHLPLVVSAYRNSIHESNGCTPNLIIFGHEISIPLEWGTELNITVYDKHDKGIRKSAKKL